MKKPKIKINQILYSLNVGNACRNREQVLTPVIVIKIGRKYFTACPLKDIEYKSMHTMYYLDGWSEKTEYSANSKLYISEAEYNEEKEIIRICSKIYKSFDYGKNKEKLSVDQIQRIENIIDEKDKS